MKPTSEFLTYLNNKERRKKKEENYKTISYNKVIIVIKLQSDSNNKVFVVIKLQNDIL